MKKSKQKIIDKYFDQFAEIENIEKIVVATYDGLLINSLGIEDSELENIPAFLSNYREIVLSMTENVSGADFQIGYYLTDRGFMVIITLGEDAIIQILARGRQNTGIVLRLAQSLRSEYSA